MSEGQNGVQAVPGSVDPEVTPKAKRRIYTPAYKKKILAEVDAAAGSGNMGKILRREGIYSSTLTGWRKERDFALDSAFSQKRGPEPKQPPPTTTIATKNVLIVRIKNPQTATVQHTIKFSEYCGDCTSRVKDRLAPRDEQRLLVHRGRLQTARQLWTTKRRMSGVLWQSKAENGGLTSRLYTCRHHRLAGSLAIRALGIREAGMVSGNHPRPGGLR